MEKLEKIAINAVLHDWLLWNLEIEPQLNVDLRIAWLTDPEQRQFTLDFQGKILGYYILKNGAASVPEKWMPLKSRPLDERLKLWRKNIRKVASDPSPLVSDVVDSMVDLVGDLFVATSAKYIDVSSGEIKSVSRALMDSTAEFLNSLYGRQEDGSECLIIDKLDSGFDVLRHLYKYFLYYGERLPDHPNNKTCWSDASPNRE